MMKHKFGIVQGRLTNPPQKKILQYFPPNWIEEIDIAKKNKFSFIEFFKDRKINLSCPFYYDHGFTAVKEVIKIKNFKSYTFCDDYFIGNSILKKKNYKRYFKTISLNLNLIDIKIYILPLFEKSDMNKKNYKKFIKKLREISKILYRHKIKLALETNLEYKSLRNLFSTINHKNTYLVYDSGNRLSKKINVYDEIRNLKKNIIHIHIKDKNFVGENVILGKGKVDFKNLFKALKDINYNKSFAFETNRGKEAIKTMKNNIRFIKKVAKSQGFTI